MLNDKEIILFAEGAKDLPLEAQDTILRQVASSPLLREQVAKVRRDLYLIDCQIPEYSLSPEYILELNKLAEVWLKARVEKRLSVKRFLFGREFLTIGIFLIVLLTMSLLMILLTK